MAYVSRRGREVLEASSPLTEKARTRHQGRRTLQSPRRVEGHKMKFMRSIRKFDTEEKQESRFSSAPSLVRIAAAFAFAAALGLAPLPTFAQHGGGGGGGAHGGGGGGGSHASSGGGGSHATSSGSGHPSGAAAPASASGGSSSGRPPVSSGA